MKPSAGGYRVAVVGASSLLGKELLAVLKERQFPVSRLVTPEVLDASEPDLPVLDLSESLEPALREADVGETDLDFAFLAAPLPRPPKNGASEMDGLAFLGSTKRLASAAQCKVIDMSDCLAGEPGGVLRVPFFERETAAESAVDSAAKYFISAHPATVVIGALLLRLAARFPVKSAVAQVFGPVSEIGAQAIEELQKQTSSLLSFQKIPQTVFGTQLAFNVLPRFGRSRTAQAASQESRVQKQLRDYLGGRAPVPALRFVHVPVFHSLACSVYIELEHSASLEAVGQVLAGGPVRLRKTSDRPASQVEASGSSEILVDALIPDAGHPNGIWIWAAVDNLRVAAVNSVEIAENLSAQKAPQVR